MSSFGSSEQLRYTVQQQALGSWDRVAPFYRTRKSALRALTQQRNASAGIAALLGSEPAPCRLAVFAECVSFGYDGGVHHEFQWAETV